ncbi:hypothetical protein J4211_01315, partial [Candidatus Woesearchaeota archaeon]|nr:hypothetical protein [Candidatus Woesearchaeota archaeon]
MKKLLIALLIVGVLSVVVFAQAADCPTSLSSSTVFSCPLRVVFDKAIVAPTDTVGFSVSGWDFVWPDVWYYTGAGWVLAKSASDVTLRLTGNTVLPTSRWIDASGTRTASVSGVNVFLRSDAGTTPRGTFAFYACNKIAGTTNSFDCNGGKWMVKSVAITSATTCIPQSQTCSVGVGACARTGAQVKACTNGVLDANWGACSVTAGAPSTEVCGNTVDEDCNGSADECPVAQNLLSTEMRLYCFDDSGNYRDCITVPVGTALTFGGLNTWQNVGTVGQFATGVAPTGWEDKSFDFMC